MDNLESDIADLKRNVEQLENALRRLEIRVTELENRGILGEARRMDQWKLILRIARVLAQLTGVPEADLAAEDAMTAKALDQYSEALDIMSQVPPGI